MKLGTLVAAAFAADILFWFLVLFGLEQVRLPNAPRGLVSFDFPYSHSLISILLLAVIVSTVWAVWGGRRARRSGVYWDGIALIAATVLSHWLLDVLVHQSDMPVMPGGAMLGFGLWALQPAAIILELALAALAYAAYAARCSVRLGRKLVVGALLLLAGAFTFEGAFGAPPVAASDGVALFSLVLIGLCITVVAWADRAR